MNTFIYISVIIIQLNVFITAITKMENCIFCDRLKAYKSHGVRESTTKSQGENKKDEIIAVLKTLNLSNKVQTIASSNYINYHKSCLYKHSSQLKPVQSNDNLTQNNEAASVNINTKIFEQLNKFIKQKIIEKRETWALADIFSLYKRLFAEELNNCPQTTSTIMKSHHLLDKILKFNNDVGRTLYKFRVFLHASDIKSEELLGKGFEMHDSMTKIKEVGAAIRKEIFEIKTKKLPKRNITVKDIIEGESKVPEKLYTLIESIIETPRLKENPNSTKQNIKQKKVLSICDSIILSATSGECKPSNCIQLALTTKSLTGSRQMINILNRLGFCISYSLTEEIETELAYACSMNKRILPFDFNNNVITNVAFDNYDRYVETSNGKDTLHDTVGIAVQNKVQLNELPIDLLNISDSNANEKRRRKYCSPFDNTIPTYTKKKEFKEILKMNEIATPCNWQRVINSQNSWMINCALRIESNKWYTWHANRTVDQKLQQKVGYLPIINASPTSDAVVLKTMNMSLEIANECNQEFIIVTYDLAIASKAYKIKTEKSDEFNRLFVNLGPFHIELSYFKVSIFIYIIRIASLAFCVFIKSIFIILYLKAIGKLIDSSGICEIMVNTGLMAAGSIKGIIGGTHYNRCKRVHPIAALAFKIIHFKRFLKSYDEKSHLGKLCVEEIIDELKFESETYDTEATIYRLSDVLKHYREYVEQTRNGQHGGTAQYVMKYIDSVELFQMFEYAIRTSDLDMYIYAATKICPWFFAFNHQNYARWLTKNINDLLNIDDTHPGLRKYFKEGGLSVRRTARNFSGTAVDLTVEQTINANAANKLTGISAFTNSIDARQRWSETHSARKAIISNFLSHLQLDDSSKNFDSTRENKMFIQQVQKFINEIENNINPFDENLNRPELFNLSTGKHNIIEIAN